MKRKGKGTFFLPPIIHIHNPLKTVTPLTTTKKQHNHHNHDRNRNPPPAHKEARTGKSSIRNEIRQSVQHVFRRINIKTNRHRHLPPESSETLQAVTETLGLTAKQINRLFRNFTRIDVDKSGFISSLELFQALEEEETHLTCALFKMMDIGIHSHNVNVNGNDSHDDSHSNNDDDDDDDDWSSSRLLSFSLSFDDFVRVCSTWCLYTKKDILNFCFDTFDNDSSGFIDENEFKILCSAVNKGSPMFPGNFDAALQMVDDNGDGVIDFREFKGLDRRFPLMLFPIFRLQEKMQRLTLGERDWVEIHRRVEMGRNHQRVSRDTGRDMHGVGVGVGVGGILEPINNTRTGTSAGAGTGTVKRRVRTTRITRLPPLAGLNPDKIDAMKCGKTLESM